MSKKKMTVPDFKKYKQEGRKFTYVTAYDYTMAKLCSEAGADMLLVGDSLGMVMLGYKDTVSVTMQDMIHHSRAVARGAEKPFVLTDMPFMSVRTGLRDAMINAGRLMAEGRANGVKIEGGRELAPMVTEMVRAGIPVMGHLGLTPQSVNALGGYRVQARALDAAQRLIEDAVALDEAGAFGIVLECLPDRLAALVKRAWHHHRDWRRQCLRRPGPGFAGSAWHVQRHPSKVCTPVCRSRILHTRWCCLLLCSRARRNVSGFRTQFRHGRRSLRGP